MKYNIAEIIDKAFTSSDLANGGLLQPTQALKFVKGAIDSAVIIKECRVVPMRGDKKQIDKITYGSAVLQKPNAVGTVPTTTTKPTTSKVTLDVAETIVAVDIGYDSLEDSIEGKGLFNTIMELTGKRMGYDLDNLALNGDTEGGTSDFLEILDGIFDQISTYSLDADAATLSDEVLFDCLKLLPSRYYDEDEAKMRFYVSHRAKLDYTKALADKNVDSAFVSYLVQGKEPRYNGIPVRKVPAITTETITYGTTTANGSKGLFINPKNIVMGIHRNIMYEFQRQPRKRIIEVTITMRLDFKLEEENACVEILNIRHSA